MNTAKQQFTVPASPNYWKTMRHLIRREYWEYKALYLWVPAFLSTILFALFSYFSFYEIGEMEPTAMYLFGRTLTDSNIYPSMFFPLAWTSALVSIFYLMSSLHADRLDRSVMFWKSLPFSDGQTVFSKLVLPLLIGPITAFVLSLLAYIGFCFLTIVYAGIKGHGFAFELFVSDAMWRDPAKVMALLPIYVAWALPTVGWMMMISAWAKSRVFPWAIGLPLLTELILTFANFHFKLGIDMLWVTNNIFARLLGGLFPGLWALADSLDGLVSVKHNMFLLGSVYEQASLQFTSGKLWFGIAVGLAMIFIAIRQRRYAEAI